MFKRLLIANRGEIALRILRACKVLGIETVAVHSSADTDLKHVRLADQSVCIGPPSAADSYLSIPAIIAAAELTRSDAIHPGYGFLAENATFAEQVQRCGFHFVGPSAAHITVMGDKVSAIAEMKKVGVPTVPGSGKPLTNDTAENNNIANEIGYPVILKAAAGGGGRGMRVVERSEQLAESLQITKSEALSAFGDGRVYMEKFLQKPRHIEVQVLADGQGEAIHIGVRDCSIQRRHQKVIEEAQAPDIDQAIIDNITSLCVAACIKLGYSGVGTFEFLYEDDCFFFIEMNTRIQVEHPVSEMVAGIDIVKHQILVATGEPLQFKQQQINFVGHAIECRINAEHPQTFIPSPGVVNHVHMPGGPGVRVDTHLYDGYAVPPQYDSLIAKLIVHGENRAEAVIRMRNALDEILIEGIHTNIELHQRLFRDTEFVKGGVDIHYLEKLLELQQ